MQRPPSWNYSAIDHHWLIEQQPPLAPREVTAFDREFADRWRCLRATDDLLTAFDAELTKLELWSTTYVFFTADHGYHFGELRLGPGKWNVYDTDVRVPMRVVGPGIEPGAKLGLVGSHVDLAATWLGLAGVETPDSMDGMSLVSGLVKNQTSIPWSTKRHLQRQQERAAAVARSSAAAAAAGAGVGVGAGDEAGAGVGAGAGAAAGFLPHGGAYVEYHGLGLVGAPGRLGDAWNNTYRALRVIDHRPNGLGNVLYAEFGTFTFDVIQFHEFYDLDVDPWQMHNQYAALEPAAREQWATRVRNLHGCTGPECRRDTSGLY